MALNSLSYLSINIIGDISLTMGAGGLLNRLGDHTLILGGITQFQVPFMGAINKSSSCRDHKIDLMEDHRFKFFAATLHVLLFM